MKKPGFRGHWLRTDDELTGPVPSTRKLLRKNGLNLSDIDLFEVNEAFAMVPMVYLNELGVDAAKLNVNGDAITLGHPLGATGSVILATLLDELERRDQTLGLASLCIGGGMGIATLIEPVNSASGSNGHPTTQHACRLTEEQKTTSRLMSIRAACGREVDG